MSAPWVVPALAELALLAVLAGVLGTWIVLRRLSFFAHAAGTATYPGLVVAGPWGLAPQVAALGAALAFAAGLAGLTRRSRLDPGAATGVLLVGALALGALLASDVYASGAGVDTLLVGSLVAVSDRDLWLTAGAVGAVLVTDAVLRRRWALATFDPDAPRTPVAELALPAAVALSAVIAVDAVGALLAGVVLVVPAATVRLMTDDLGALRAGAAVLAFAEGSAALWAAGRVDVGPGPLLALIGGLVFGVVAVSARWAR